MAGAGSAELAGRVNAVLDALAVGELEGRLLLTSLADGSLRELVDAQGRSCQAAAVQALLRLGFPWALEIDPETLVWFRRAQLPRRRSSPRLTWALALVTVLGSGLGVGAYFFGAQASLIAPATQLVPLEVRPVRVAPTAAEREARQRQVVENSRTRFQGCVDRSSKDWIPDAVTLEFKVLPSGFVEKVTVPPSEQQTSFGACLVEVGLGLKFPSSDVETSLSVPLRIR